MSRLKLHMLERADFVKYHEGPGAALFVPGNDPPHVGARVTVEVIFQAGPRVLLHGFVLWRRPAGDARARPGAGIGIDDAEQSKLRYLLGYVRGGLMDVRERRRLPVRLRVAYSGLKGGRRVNFTRDINEEGAFVRTAEMLDIGASTLLLISPPGGEYKPLEVQATVTRQHAAAGDRGVGVRFDFRDDHERARWAAFVGRLEEDYLDGRLADDALL